MTALQVLGLFLMLFCGYGVIVGLLHREKIETFLPAPYYWLVWLTGTLLGLWLVLK